MHAQAERRLSAAFIPWRASLLRRGDRCVSSTEHWSGGVNRSVFTVFSTACTSDAAERMITRRAQVRLCLGCGHPSGCHCRVVEVCGNAKSGFGSRTQNLQKRVACKHGQQLIPIVSSKSELYDLMKTRRCCPVKSARIVACERRRWALLHPQ